jgi:hypothetical protein
METENLTIDHQAFGYRSFSFGACYEPVPETGSTTLRAVWNFRKQEFSSGSEFNQPS